MAVLELDKIQSSAHYWVLKIRVVFRVFVVSFFQLVNYILILFVFSVFFAIIHVFSVVHSANVSPHLLLYGDRFPPRIFSTHKKTS